MKYRKLRIAWSVAWGVVALLLCGLWVRSYYWFDFSGLIPGGALVSNNGSVVFTREMRVISHERDPSWNALLNGASYAHSEIEIVRLTSIVTIPFWAAILVVFSLGVAAWMPLRFSLRTLLIATTLVAVVMGFATWAVSK